MALTERQNEILKIMDYWSEFGVDGFNEKSRLFAVLV